MNEDSVTVDGEDSARRIPRGEVRRRALRRLGLAINSKDFTDDERSRRWGLPGLIEPPPGKDPKPKS